MRIPPNTNTNNSTYRIINNKHNQYIGVQARDSSTSHAKPIFTPEQIEKNRSREGVIGGGENASGLEYSFKYLPDSTEEEPLIIATGVDEYNIPFERIISVNDINPYNATYIEMRALLIHRNISYDEYLGNPNDRNPDGSFVHGLNGKNNYMGIFDKKINDMRSIGREDIAFRISMIMNLIIERQSKSIENWGLDKK